MVSELVTDHLIVVLNKVDLLPLDQRDRLVAKARKRLAATFALTRFKACAMVPVAAKPGASTSPLESVSCGCRLCAADIQVLANYAPSSHLCRKEAVGSAPQLQRRLHVPHNLYRDAYFPLYRQKSWIIFDRRAVSVCAGGGDEEAKAAPVGVDQLMQELAARLPPRPRSPDGPFLFAVDHCFAIRGQGTVLTGTVLQVLLLRAHSSGSAAKAGCVTGQAEVRPMFSFSAEGCVSVQVKLGPQADAAVRW